MEEHSLSQRAFAETLGTALLVLVGPGSVVATLCSPATSRRPPSRAPTCSASRSPSGSSSPRSSTRSARSRAATSTRRSRSRSRSTKRFPWREVPAYWGAQVVGAVLGALGIWARVRPDRRSTSAWARRRSTRTPTTWGSAIFAEGIGTFMLMFAILGIVDSRSPGDFAGLVIGGVVVAIIMVVGPITGASLNPARAFGPELVSRDRRRRDALEPAHPGLHPARPRRRRAGGVRLRLPRRRRAWSSGRSRRPSPIPTPATARGRAK